MLGIVTYLNNCLTDLPGTYRFLKKSKYGLAVDDAYLEIIRSSQTSNKDFDRMAGIREDWDHENI